MYSARASINAGNPPAVNDAFGGLWNPHASLILKLKQIVVFNPTNPASGFSFCGRRFTARGTPASSITPGISNDNKRGAAPPSGATLDFGLVSGYTAQPTLDTNDTEPTFVGLTGVTRNGDGVCYDFPGEGLDIPPGSGWGWSATSTIAGSLYTTFYWVED